MSNSIAKRLRGGALLIASMMLATGCAEGGGGGGRPNNDDGGIVDDDNDGSDGGDDGDIGDGPDDGGGASVCNNSCEFASDGECDDGGSGSDFDVCSLGSDCEDCGPRDGGDPDDGGGAPDDDGGGSATVFLFATGNDGIVSYFNPAALSATVAVNTNLESGSSTDFFVSRDVAIDAAGSLYIASEGDSSISIFENATGATGTRLPDRKITGLSTQIDSPLGVAIDVENDILFVAHADNELILVFDDISAAGFDGDVAPSRTFTRGPGFSPLQIVFAAGDLYVSDQAPAGSNDIQVFEAASTLEGQVNPDRTITNPDFSSALTIYVDQADRLLAVSRDTEVFIYNNASTRSGGAPADVVITVEGANTISAVAADSNDVLYLADSGESVIYVFDDIPSLTSGAFTPDRTFEGGLSSPFRLLVHEP